MATVREAAPADLSAVALLTSRRRKLLGTWQPDYWSPAADADDMQEIWLGQVIANPRVETLAAVDADEVIGFCVGIPQEGPQGAQLFVDDMCVAEDRWEDAGSTLLGAVDAQCAVLNVPCPEIELAIAAIHAGFELVGHYRLRRLREPKLPRRHIQAPPGAVGEPAFHTFGPIDPRAPGALIVGDAGGSYVVGSASLPAPPIYDPGGTTCVIDRIGGPAGTDLLEDACAVASVRGDVQVVVAHSAADVDLDDRLAADGWGEPFVDVYMRG